ncbi:acetylxylan esterase [Coprobacter sp.]
MKKNRNLILPLLYVLFFGAYIIMPENIFAIAASRIKSPSDSLTLVMDSDDEDMIFVSPQNIDLNIEIKGVLGGKRNVNLICKITTDDYRPVDSLSYKIEYDGKSLLSKQIKYKPLHAGFYRFTVYLTGKSIKSNTLRFNVGFDPENIISPVDAPRDFELFWEQTKSELKKVSPCYKMTLLEGKSSAVKNMYHVEMYSWGNVKVEGYYCVPKKPGKYPVIIAYMGYGVSPYFPDATSMPDFCEFVLSVRGQGIQKAANIYGDWITYGLQDKCSYYYRGAYMDLIRAIDFVCSRPEVDKDKVVAEGGSQGGAFTLVASALDDRIKAAAPHIPFLTDFRDYFGICPWPRSAFESYLKKNPEKTWDDIYKILSYFDVKNFAPHVQCPVVMGIGLQDNTCPPHINFASYNLIPSEKKYYVYRNQKHSVDQSWWPMRASFFREILNRTASKKVFILNDGNHITVHDKDISFYNDICIPSRLYMLADTENKIFIKPLIKRWRPYEYFVRFSGDVPFSVVLGDKVVLDKPKNDKVLITNLIEGNDFKAVKSIESTILTGQKSKDNGTVFVQILGDSYVDGAFFKDALLTKGYVPNVRLVGQRGIKGETEQYDEGRGGWRLADYFKVPKDKTSFHGFMQPEGNCRYWGATGFWKNCHRVIKNEAKDFMTVYHCGRYDDYAGWFDEKTGYLNSPSKDDLQYDNDLGSFVWYDGEKWIPVKESDFNWSFDYGKYLKMWRITPPRFFFELLGLNDFRYDINADFSQWNAMIEDMKNSYLKAVPDGKFVILIPTTTCGSINNISGDFTPYQNAAMWRLRKNIIDVFDNREQEGYYIIDTGATVDEDNGYIEENGIQKKLPHPYRSYPEMGVPLAAFIQYYR